MQLFTLAILVSVTSLIDISRCNYCANAEKNDDKVIVETKSGKLRGKLLLDGNRQPYRAFRGIPYATPPTGNLRFRPPEPIEPWNGILDATHDGAECPQPTFPDNRFSEGNEDCLFLNVYSPGIKNEDATKLLPVLVFIHGGGFYIGTGNSKIYGAQKFMEVDVVLVTLNYRLGVLGFMSTEDENSPGNYGLLDMVQALRWIQNNIEVFGGDPSKVTIIGESAGGASVIYLMLSPLAKGLFHAAISQSGTPLAEWSFQATPMKWTKRIARELSCPTDHSIEIVRCLKEKPIESIVRATEKFHRAVMFPMYTSPVVDKRFLPDDPLTLLRDGKIVSKVPFVAGVVRDEGIAFYMLLNSAGIFKTKGQRFLAGEEFGTKFLPYLDQWIKPQMKSVVKKVTEEYFFGKNMNDPLVFQNAFSELLADTMFRVGTDRTLHLMAKADVPSYAYLYNHSSPMGMVTSGAFGKPKGNFVAHGDELSIEFDFHPVKGDNDQETIQDAEMSKLMNSLWRNFAQTREPTYAECPSMPQWLPYSEDNPAYLELSLTPSMKQGMFSNRTAFWVELVPQEIQKYCAEETILKEEL